MLSIFSCARAATMRKSVFVYLCALLARATSEPDKDVEEDFLEMSCVGGVLDESVRARCAQPTRFTTVALRGCAPPAGETYEGALRALNVRVGDALELTDVPPLPPIAFDGMPPLFSLTVKNIRPVNEDKVREKRDYNWAKRHNGSVSGVLVQEMTALLPLFLKEASLLQRFVAINNFFTTLPGDLFVHTPKIRFIDLSDNALETLPQELFLGLPELVSLFLSNNRLTVSVLDVIAPVTTLTDLRLNLNPIGDHCQPGTETSVLSGLEQLSTVDLSVTKATRVCGDWLTRMRSLRHLYLGNNSIETISCAQFSKRRAIFVDEARIELTNNPLRRINCTGDDFLPIVLYDRLKPSQMWLNQPAACDCPVFWLVRSMEVRQVDVVFFPKSSPICTENSTLLQQCNDEYDRTHQ